MLKQPTSGWHLPPLIISEFRPADKETVCLNGIDRSVGTVSYITGWIMLVSALFGFFFVGLIGDSTAVLLTIFTLQSLIWMGRMKAASQVAAGGGAGAAGGAGMPMGMDPMMDDEMGMPPGGGPPMDDFDDGMGPGGPPPY